MKFVFILTLLVLLLAPGYTASYDKFHSQFPGVTDERDFVNFENWIVEVKTVGYALGILPEKFRGKEKSCLSIGTFELQASGFVVQGGFIVAANHVVSPHYVLIKTDYHVVWKVPVTSVLSKTIIINEYIPATVIWQDEKADIAVLLPVYDRNMTLEGVSFKMESAAVEEGDAVSIVVREVFENGERGSWHEIRQGRVISPYPLSVFTPEFGDLHLLTQAELEPTDITHSTTLYPGDSGSPLIAYKEGEPVIVGVVTKMIALRVTLTDVVVFYYATRIDKAKRFIEAYIDLQRREKIN